MPRTRSRIDPKLTLTILGLAASAALYTHDVMAQAAPGQAHRGVHISEHRNADGDFALVRESAHGTNISGNSVDSTYIESIKRSVPGDFLWFRDGGKAYVVQDAQVLAKARQAWAPVDRLGEQMDVHGKQMDQHGKVLDALGKEMDSASREKRFAAMEEIGRKMEQAGKPMNALGKQMDALGKQMERESHAAEATMRELIREAQAKGLARPAPERT
jgi:hypothetical protein